MSINNNESARRKRTLEWMVPASKRDILHRRIFAIEQEIIYSNPFTAVDEMLFRCGKPAPPVVGSENDPGRFYDVEESTPCR